MLFSGRNFIFCIQSSSPLLQQYIVFLFIKLSNFGTSVVCELNYVFSSKALHLLHLEALVRPFRLKQFCQDYFFRIRMKFLKLLKIQAFLLFVGVLLLVCIHYNSNKLWSYVVGRNQSIAWEGRASNINKKVELKKKVRYKKAMQLTKPHDHDEMENVSKNLLNFTFSFSCLFSNQM